MPLLKQTADVLSEPEGGCGGGEGVEPEETGSICCECKQAAVLIGLRCLKRSL